MTDLEREIRELLKDDVRSAPPPADRGPAIRRTRRRQVTIAAGGAVGAIVLAATSFAGVRAFVDGDAVVPADRVTTTGPTGPAEPAARPGPGFPAQPEGVPWPTEGWPEGTWPAGVDRTAIDEAVDVAFNDGDDPRVRAVVVVHGGEIVYERYSPNPLDGESTIMPSFSMAKSIASALVGIQVREGMLDVRDPAPVPQWDAGDPRAEITIENLLHMASGLEWVEGHKSGSDLVAAATSGDAAGYAAEHDLVHEPGTEFLYSGGDTFLLARILADALPDGTDLRTFMDAELFDKLGMDPMYLEFDQAGTWLAAYAADTTARNFAKLGLLYLRDGIWDGERILPEGWVEYTRTPSPADPIYGAHWWLDPERPEVLYAVGVFGQVITVDPEHDLTFVTTATDGASDVSLAISEAILDAFAAAE